jgi:hypothetical protein
MKKNEVFRIKAEKLGTSPKRYTHIELQKLLKDSENIRKSIKVLIQEYELMDIKMAATIENYKQFIISTEFI